MLQLVGVLSVTNAFLALVASGVDEPKFQRICAWGQRRRCSLLLLLVATVFLTLACVRVVADLGSLLFSWLCVHVPLCYVQYIDAFGWTWFTRTSPMVAIFAGLALVVLLSPAQGRAGGEPLGGTFMHAVWALLVLWAILAAAMLLFGFQVLEPSSHTLTAVDRGLFSSCATTYLSCMGPLYAFSLTDSARTRFRCSFVMLGASMGLAFFSWAMDGGMDEWWVESGIHALFAVPFVFGAAAGPRSDKKPHSA